MLDVQVARVATADLVGTAADGPDPRVDGGCHHHHVVGALHVETVVVERIAPVSVVDAQSRCETYAPLLGTVLSCDQRCRGQLDRVCAVRRLELSRCLEVAGDELAFRREGAVGALPAELVRLDVDLLRALVDGGVDLTLAHRLADLVGADLDLRLKLRLDAVHVGLHRRHALQDLLVRSLELGARRGERAGVGVLPALRVVGADLVAADGPRLDVLAQDGAVRHDGRVVGTAHAVSRVGRAVEVDLAHDLRRGLVHRVHDVVGQPSALVVVFRELVAARVARHHRGHPLDGAPERVAHDVFRILVGQLRACRRVDDAGHERRRHVGTERHAVLLGVVEVVGARSDREDFPQAVWLAHHIGAVAHAECVSSLPRYREVHHVDLQAQALPLPILQPLATLPQKRGGRVDAVPRVGDANVTEALHQLGTLDVVPSAVDLLDRDALLDDVAEPRWVAVLVVDDRSERYQR